MLADRRNPAARDRPRARRVVEVQRRAVVDQPQPVVPEQEVRVLGGAVDVRHERVEPDDVGREHAVDVDIRRRAERQRARQEVDAEIEPGACDEQILDLGIGLGAAEHGIERDERELGDV